MTPCPCPACQGKRLKPEALAVTVGGLSIWQATELPVDEELAFFNGLTLTETQQIIAAQILKEIHARLGFLQSVGLSYLTLSRASVPCPAARASVSGWPPRSAAASWGCCISWTSPPSACTSGITTSCWPRSAALRDLGNTLIVVEHDEDTMRAADYLIDIGPGAGALGGQVVACGTPEEVMANP